MSIVNEKLSEIAQHMDAVSNNTSSTLTEIKDLVADTKKQSKQATLTTVLALLTFIASLIAIYIQSQQLSIKVL